jgi:hypothetical protein
MTITAEDWVRRIEEVLDKFNLSKEEYWKDPDKFYENIKDEEIRAFLWWEEKCVNNTIL